MLILFHQVPENRGESLAALDSVTWLFFPFFYGPLVITAMFMTGTLIFYFIKWEWFHFELLACVWEWLPDLSNAMSVVSLFPLNVVYAPSFQYYMLTLKNGGRSLGTRPPRTHIHLNTVGGWGERSIGWKVESNICRVTVVTMWSMTTHRVAATVHQQLWHSPN